MSEQINSAETVTPQTLAKVIRASHNILDRLGIVNNTGDHERTPMLSATVPLESSALTQGATDILPTVKINRPTGEFAKTSRWSYEVSYGMQDPEASRHVLVMNGEIPQAEMSFYDGRPDRPLTELEAQAVVTDLSRIAEIDQ